MVLKKKSLVPIHIRSLDLYWFPVTSRAPSLPPAWASWVHRWPWELQELQKSTSLCPSEISTRIWNYAPENRFETSSKFRTCSARFFSAMSSSCWQGVLLPELLGGLPSRFNKHAWISYVVCMNILVFIRQRYLGLDLGLMLKTLSNTAVPKHLLGMPWCLQLVSLLFFFNGILKVHRRLKIIRPKSIKRITIHTDEYKWVQLISSPAAGWGFGLCLQHFAFFCCLRSDKWWATLWHVEMIPMMELHSIRFLCLWRFHPTDWDHATTWMLGSN